MAKKHGLVVYVMRAQPPHRAHIETCAEALDHGDKLLIFIGSAHRHPTIKNPWTYEERVKMVQDALKDHFGEPHHTAWSDYPPESVLSRIHFAPLRDYLYQDYRWISEVQSKADAVAQGDSIAIIGCKKDNSSYYLDMFPRWKFIEVPYMYGLDATDIRYDLFEMVFDATEERMDSRMYPSTISALQLFDNEMNVDGSMARHLLDEWVHYREYRKLFDSLKYPVNHVTTDAVLIASGCVLLVRRRLHPGRGLWAVPGGFLDTGLESLPNTLKELKEETRINLRPDELLAAFKREHVFMHPQRSLRGRTITFAHEFDLGHGTLPSVNPKGGDDADRAQWVPIADFHKMEDQMFEDHYDIVSQIISRY